jgi:hypothetical protein
MHAKTRDVSETEMDIFNCDISDAALEAAAPSDGYPRYTLTEPVWTLKPCGPGSNACPSAR